MRMHISPDLPQRDFTVTMNRGSTEPFGIIELDELGTSYLAVDTDEDADRLIRAAARIKEMRAAIAVPHEFERADHGRCAVCGTIKDGHPVPDATAIVAESIATGTPVIVEDDGLKYDPDFDNCAGSPGCGDKRVLFRWNAVDQAACPRCFENIYGGPPDPSSIVTIPIADADPDATFAAEPAHGTIGDGPDCGCGLGAARCRELEDGGAL